MKKPEVVELNQREYTPDIQYTNAMWSAMTQAFTAITTKETLSPEIVELYTDWLIQLVEDDDEKETIYKSVNTLNEKLKDQLAKRKGIEVAELSNDDRDLCWKKANIRAVGKVVKWFNRYYSNKEHRIKIGMGTLACGDVTADAVVYFREEKQ